MDLKKYRSKLIGDESERAVSPVIGVILMVAITVILAAVIAAFVLDLGPGSGDTAPQANYEWTNDSGTYVVEHRGGEPVDLDSVRVSGGSATMSGEFNTGDTINVTPDNQGDRVQLIWERGNSEDILTEYSG
ncbi:type IV pilin [Saliphagus sp. GCM10025334]